MKNINLFIFSLIVIGLFSCQEKKSESNLQWKFDNFEKLTYEYYQITENKSSFLKEILEQRGKNGTIFNKMTGSLIVSPKGDGKADIVFKNMEMSLLSVSENGDTTQTMIQTAPDFFMQDMDEFGKVGGSLNQQTELLSQTLFPIPSKKLKVGEKNKVSIAMPFNMFGSVINVTGFNEITLNSVQDSRAKVSTIIDVSEFDIPKEANVNYECYMKGSSNYTFDTVQGYFDSLSLNITMVAKNMTNYDEKENDSLSGQEAMMKQMTKGMSMEMNTRISLKLKEVK